MVRLSIFAKAAIAAAWLAVSIVLTVMLWVRFSMGTLHHHCTQRARVLCRSSPRFSRL
jgi:hypothetical protein